MIKKDEALKLLKKYINIEGIIRHSLGVSEIGFEISSKIKNKNQDLKIDPNKVEIACLLHDIGRAREGIHELNTVEILTNEGLADIADIAFHGFVYEKFLMKGDCKKIYLPNSIENKIVVLADSYFAQIKLTLDERFLDLEERYKDNKDIIDAMRLAKPRFYELEKEIQSLM